MDEFLNKLVRVSFGVLVLVGVVALALGGMLLFWPDIFLQIVRWGSVGFFMLGGIVLFVCALYGYVLVKNISKSK